MNKVQGITLPRAQIWFHSDASKLALSSNEALSLALGTGRSPGRVVVMAHAWAHSAPLLGITDLPPFPLHPNFRLLLRAARSLLQRKSKSSFPGLRFAPRLPIASSKNPLPPTKPPQSHKAGTATRTGFTLQSSQVKFLLRSSERGLVAAGEVSFYALLHLDRGWFQNTSSKESLLVQ